MRTSILITLLATSTFAPAQSARRIPASSLLIPAHKHQPFSATVTMEGTQTFASGEVASGSMRIEVARDSRGFVVEKTYAPTDSEGSAPTELTFLAIFDPVKQQATGCMPERHFCWIVPYRVVSEHKLMALPIHMNGQPLRLDHTEKLSAKVLVGVAANGTREAFAGGRTRTDWYSRGLGLHLETIWTDPTEGTRTVRFETLNRVEPDVALFAVPAGYTVRAIPVRDDDPNGIRARDEAMSFHDISHSFYLGERLPNSFRDPVGFYSR